MKRKAMSMIEVLIALAIIGISITTVFISVFPMQKFAMQTQIEMDMFDFLLSYSDYFLSLPGANINVQANILNNKIFKKNNRDYTLKIATKTVSFDTVIASQTTTTNATVISISVETFFDNKTVVFSCDIIPQQL